MLLLSKNSNCVHRNMVLVGEFYENEDYSLHRDSVERIFTEDEVRQLIAEALEQQNG